MENKKHEKVIKITDDKEYELSGIISVGIDVETIGKIPKNKLSDCIRTAIKNYFDSNKDVCIAYNNEDIEVKYEYWEYEVME